MKFACDRCAAQYMISDEKVGPAGAKVRCKKCGHVIVVRRADAASSANGAAPHAATAPAPPAKEKGLDAELGQAFDSAFGDPPAKEGANPAKDLDATQAMGSEEAARAAAQAAPPATEWYVAIGQAQVGPLPLAEVKKKWESGDVGPDSLVWRPGMGDWTKLNGVADLAAWLAPVARAPARGARTAAERRPEAGARASDPGPAASVQAAGADVAWKPAGASALAALASEEISTRGAAEAKPAAAARPAPGGARSLVDAMGLPDGGGVDPTGAIPLPIKALERTGEKRLTAVARGAEATRRKRTSRTIAVAAGIVLLGGGAAAGAFLLLPHGALAPTPSPVAAPPPAAPAPAAQPVAAPAAPEPAAPAPAPPPAAAPSTAGERTAVAAAPPRAEPKAEPPARREPPPARAEPARREPARVAQAPKREPEAAPPAAPAPAPAAAAAPRKKGDVLEFESNDAALEAALGGGSAGASRSVYVPPPAGAAALPAKLSTDQINEAVLGRVDALRQCVSDQKARDPDATGTLKMRWVVMADGGVKDVKTLTPEFADGQFAQCITGVVKSIKFPRSTTTGQEVTFPFRF